MHTRLQICLFIISLLIFQVGKSQITTGGNASITFTNGVYVDLSPMIGYKIEKFSAGISPFLAYSKLNSNIETCSYGTRLFGQFIVYQGFFLHAEFEATNIKEKTIRQWILGIPLGGGCEYEIAKNTRAQCAILYDVLLDKNSPKQNPEIRGGIVYSF